MMNGRSIRRALWAGALLAVLAGLDPSGLSAQAEAPRGQAGGALANPTPPPKPAQGPASPGEVQRLFDAYTVMQAQQVLGLSDEKFAVFLPRLRQLQQTRRKHDVARQQLVGRLGRLAAADPADDAKIREELKALADLDEQYPAALRQAYEALDETLDLRQRARFRQFEQQIERRKFDLIMRARDSRR